MSWEWSMNPIRIFTCVNRNVLLLAGSLLGIEILLANKKLA